jgi:hypothetical protein
MPRAAKLGRLDAFAGSGGFRRYADLLSPSDGKRLGQFTDPLIRCAGDILIAAFAIALIGALFYFYGGHKTPDGQPPLRRLTTQNVVEVKIAFNAAKHSRKRCWAWSTSDRNLARQSGRSSLAQNVLAHLERPA